MGWEMGCGKRLNGIWLLNTETMGQGMRNDKSRVTKKKRKKILTITYTSCQCFA